MSHIWTFSPSSEPYLQRCLTAASLQENDNKWTQKFGRKSAKIFNKSDSEEKPATEVIETASSPEEHKNDDVSITNEDFFDSFEHEIRLDFIAKECSKNPDLITKMAQRLSTNTVEKLFNDIFTSKDRGNWFLTTFLCLFLPSYIKHQYSWLCIDLLTKTNQIYPELFQKLLKILVEDTQVPNQVLNKYVSSLNEDERTTFLYNLTNIELSSECFVNNILTICTAYKDCTKTDRIQNFIRMNLIQHSKSCFSDRNYGRLFLAYLQAEKSSEHTINIQQLEECLEVHRSPFQRPCIMMLKDLARN